MADSSKTTVTTPIKAASSKRAWFQSLIGLGIGTVFLWLAFRSTTWQQVQSILSRLHSGWLAIAILTYGIDLSLRVSRWRYLLTGIKLLSFKSVGSALLVGYAMNNVLPARLGELVRANFTGSRYGLSRTAVLASIAVERVLDGLIVVACLVIGRLFIVDSAILNRLLIVGSALFSGVFCVLWFTSRSSLNWLLHRVPDAIKQKLQSFQKGLSTMRGGRLNRAIALSGLIWVFEGIALWAVLNAVGVYLSWQQMLSVVGAVSLSTLLPSPPGFVGTYQYAFALIVGLMGYTAAQGIAAATATQLFLLGSVTLIGLGLYAYTHIAAEEKTYDG
ncbi:MAG: lysylphosphatidylglycerol synthase transmembrane domain-containing protein [Elainellaceae cyanobacterium]